MKTFPIVPDDITVPERLRAVNPSKVRQIAESMAAIGLQQPISVHHVVGDDGDQLTLVAGAHRLSAAKSLGWDFIDCICVELDDIDRQLWEIDENLMRSELTPTELAEHLAKRKELWEARQSAQLAPIESKREDGKGHRSEGFAAETAKATGVAKASVNRAISRADAIPLSVRAKIKGTKLDTGVYLDSLKKLSADEQWAKVTADLAALDRPPAPPNPKPKTVVVPEELDADEEQYQALWRAWNKAGATARRRFMSDVEWRA